MSNFVRTWTTPKRVRRTDANDLLLLAEEELMHAASRWLASLETYERRKGPVERAGYDDCIEELRAAIVHWQRDRDAVLGRTVR